MTPTETYSADGEHPVGSLKLGDKFFYRSEWFALNRATQRVGGRNDQVHIFVVDSNGRSREFLLHPMLMFPSVRVASIEAQKPPW